MTTSRKTIKSDFSPVVSGKTVTATVQPANVVITTLPYGMVQDEGTGGGYDSFVLTNIGDTETTVTLTPQGSFFTIDATSMTLGASKSGNTNVTGLTQPAGAYEGSVALSGTGVRSGLSIPIYLLSVVPPTGSVIAEAAVTRVDLIAPESKIRAALLNSRIQEAQRSTASSSPTRSGSFRPTGS